MVYGPAAARTVTKPSANELATICTRLELLDQPELENLECPTLPVAEQSSFFMAPISW